MIGIYKITNLQNNKVYIGQAVDIKRRWCEHESHSFSPKHLSYNYAIHCAIRKYGVKNFSFEVLEECEENQLNEREIYWINKYNSKIDGYNMTEGGVSSISHIVSFGFGIKFIYPINFSFVQLTFFTFF